MLIDLDHFKAVNDRFGHHAGDEIRRVMAGRLKADYFSNCFAARLGGDEFVLLISDQAILKDLSSLLRRPLLRNADAALCEAKSLQRGSAMIAGKTEPILHWQAEPASLRLVQP